MIAAPAPQNESSRLAALAACNILDTAPEADYDRITRLASIICGTPIALVSLVDRERQWFKSRVGLEAPETHRDLAFCAHAILNPSEAMVVPDTFADERFRDNPLVVGGPKIRSYLGCPLTLSTGETLGTLCAIDTEARTFTSTQLEALQLLSEQVMDAIELRDKLRIVSESESLVQEAKATLEKLVGQLTESNTELERFAHVASHDLQEPIRMITSFSGLIQSRYGEQLDPQANKYLTYVIEGGERMHTMITDLLQYARTGNSAALYKTTDSGNELRHALDNLAAVILERQAEITFDVLPQIRCNPVPFMRLLQNLIGNALKFQKEDASPEIHIGAQDQGEFWRFSIADNGIGMDEEGVKVIFEPFRRLHSWKEYRGTGIGLAECKKIVESHGGTIWVTSEPGKGSTFYFTIPK